MPLDADRSTSNSLLRILLIEDNRGDARLFEDHLQDSGQEVVLRWEVTLADGLREASDEPPDVLVVDLGLPDSEDAATVRRCVEALPSSVPVVVLTGEKTLDTALSTLQAGAAEYLQKEELSPGLVQRTLRWAHRQAKMEAQLRTREEQLRSVMENVSEGIFRTTREEGLTYANQSFARMFGYESVAEVLEVDPKVLYAEPEERRRLIDVVDEENAADGEEVEFRRKDGSTFTGLLSGTAVRGERRDTVYYDGVVTDITEQKRRERELAEREARYRAIAESAQDGIVTMDADSTIQFANPAVEDIFGYAPEELVGESMTMLMPERHRKNHEEALDRFLETGEETMNWSATEFPGLRKDGTEIYLSISFAVYEQQGESYFEGVIREVTERKNRERKLRVLSEAMEQAQESVMIMEGGPVYKPGPRILYVNSAFEEMTGYAEEEVLGETPRILEGAETSADVMRDRRAALEAGEGWEGEAIGYRKGGRLFMLHRSVAPVRDEDGEIEYWVSVQQDVTKARVQEQALRYSRERYRSLFRDSNDAILVHDLEGNIRETNPRAEALFGLDTGGLIGESVAALHAPEDTGVAQRMLEALRAGVPFRAVSKYEQVDGTTFWGEFSATVSEIEDETVARTMIRDVTDRWEVEATLRARESQLRGIANSVPGVVFQFVVSPDGTYGFDFISERAEDIMGLPPDPDTFFERGANRVPDLHQEEIVNSIEAAVDEETVWRVKTPFVKPSGEKIWILATATPEYRGDDLVFNGVFLDITDQKEAEEALREERDLLDRIFEVSPAAIVVLDRNGNFVRASEQAKAVLGIEKEEVTQRAFNDADWDITTPKGEPIPDEELPFARVFATEEPLYNVEHAIRWPDGQRRLLSASGAPLRGDDGEVEGAVFHLEDITERREIEHRFRGVFENAGLGIALLDETGTILEANPALESMLGYEPGGLRHCSFAELTHPEDLEADQQRFDELTAGARDEYQLEKRYVRRNGETFWAHLTVSRRELPDGVQVVGMIENIDERKRQKEQLRKAKEEAERMNRLKSAFLANMSHEIRTPLTAILGFAEIIGDDVDDGDEGTIPRCARRIGKSGRRLLETLDGVLNLSRLEAGEMDLAVAPVDLTAEAGEGVEQFELQAEQEGITLQGPTGAPVWGRADEGGLQVVLRNLLSNAIKYTEAGGRVTVRTQTEEETVVLTVEDTGIGMDPEATDELFQAFTQASEGIGREYEGTGLGLAVTRRVVEQMGGKITVETEAGVGSCFTVRLPRVDAPETIDD